MGAYIDYNMVVSQEQANDSITCYMNGENPVSWLAQFVFLLDFFCSSIQFYVLCK